MNELISIVVPVYNVEKYLSRCVDSIIHQSYRNLEIILVDDGSTDNSLQICYEYANKDKRVIVIHQDNQGASAARNSGIQIAKGTYIGFVDSDDYIDDRMYELLYDAVKHENYSHVISHVRIANVYEDGNIDENKGMFPRKKEETFTEYLTGMLLQRRSSSICSKLFPISLFNNLRLREGHVNEDALLLFEIRDYVEKVVYVDYVGYFLLQKE